MDQVMDILSGCFLLVGILFLVSGAVGVLRFPDFFTRMHAASVTDTLAAGSILIGLMLQSPNGMVVVKLIMILMMMLFINPSASHALAKAAVYSGLRPLIDKKENK
ncbi:monovalent cation/H(+) antiporter subunit G [Simiduia curdlanivorans]|uniref:Monovalent cation/H(+) antiporter subunit G n=1 Tax=Simiduia curdlanivorans TaxID=1492769 RepID=A0ABV8V223_9GAMM|nr:monovalent cation/H(+) antiporter subunit G [Simiduia curdlanivorans]MDN3637978.1 monovalent cation/H(+) antiporter subunit G [Simiduia curdlanivorans]